MMVRLKDLRVLKGLTQWEMGQVLGVSRVTYSRYESGLRDPDYSTLKKIADFFQVSIDYLLDATNDSAPYNLASEHGTASGSNSFIKKRGIPILGTIKAGVPVWSGDSFSDEVIEIGDGDADGAMYVSGDSMVYAGIFDGDIVLLRKADRGQNGQIVAAGKDDGFGTLELTLKYYHIDRLRGPVLRAANPEYEDIPVSEGYQVFGAFAGLVRYNEPRLSEIEGLELRVDNMTAEWSDLVKNLAKSGLGAADIDALVNMVKKFKAE